MTLQMKSRSKQSKIGKMCFEFLFNSFIFADRVFVTMIASRCKFFLLSYILKNCQFVIKNDSAK